MIVKDGRAHQVSVETGIRQGDRVQITKGLSGGETVIVDWRLRSARQHQGEDCGTRTVGQTPASRESQADAGKD